ncbi:SA1362 family protein [Thalassobacillus pellis]|uniref:SA1362 family protein n=1 Tax=Thalassobacillus pellis TaxID=748008 RepID=UPI00195FE97F|nr:SA1362 family protein [Thalassobacillus pellis]MBM7552320.1 mannitol-specific phosphotransferase system IIBC component [Thalassobacillus pellis]
MPRSRMMPVIYVLIGLAVVGVVTRLVTDTMGFLTNILIMVGFAAVLYLVISRFVLKNRTSDEMKKYKQAVRQSKMKYKGKPSKPKSSPKPVYNPSPIANKKKRKAQATHLRVIEGNKNKKKNRASS